MVVMLFGENDERYGQHATAFQNQKIGCPSGVTAGNTALCPWAGVATPATTGAMTFSTLRQKRVWRRSLSAVHGKLPNARTGAYKAKLQFALHSGRRAHGAGAIAGFRPPPWTCCAPAHPPLGAFCRKRRA